MNRQFPEVVDEEAMILEVRAAIVAGVPRPESGVVVQVASLGVVTVTGVRPEEHDRYKAAILAVNGVQSVVIDGHVYARQDEHDLPFPPLSWPPPEPSASASLSRDVVASHSDTSLFHIAGNLERSLKSAGYSDLRFFGVQDGFAIATRLEQIQRNGRGSKGSSRWESGILPAAEFTLKDYLKALLHGRRGYYRALLFVVTPHPVSPQPGQSSADQVRQLSRRGALALPYEIGLLEFSKKHKVTVLIYEFEKYEDDAQPALVTPGRLPGDVHIRQSGVLKELQRKR